MTHTYAIQATFPNQNHERKNPDYGIVLKRKIHFFNN